MNSAYFNTDFLFSFIFRTKETDVAPDAVELQLSKSNAEKCDSLIAPALVEQGEIAGDGKAKKP